MLVTLSITLALAAAIQAAERPTVRVHSVCDISQEFTFYMDGRFHRQYLQGVGRDVRNWGSLSRLDLSNVNLLVLSGGDAHVAYSEAAIEHVDAYVRDGGTVLLMADGREEMPPGADVVAHFGAELTPARTKEPLTGVDARIASEALIELRRGTVLELGEGWTALVLDAEGRSVLASKAHGHGWVLVGSRGLFGHKPDASDPINAEWVRPLLVGFATTKVIDATQPHRPTWAEHEENLGSLTLEYTDGTARFADAIADEYFRAHSHLVEITGVEPSPGMIKRLLVLPTGGGGFSSGERIAIGAWWGGYPKERYPMVELVAHEAGHSWVLPHPEPLWNEPIATYLGIQVGKRLEMPEAQQTLERQIEKGRRHDPDFTQVDPLGDTAPRDLVWGKSYYVFEQLEQRFGPGALAKYFTTKRQLLDPERSSYTLDDCIAVWSRAVGEDLFEWFRSLAFDVQAERTDLWP